MGIEYELKYSATCEGQEAVAAALGLPGQVLRMRTTYFDAPDGALSRRRWTLRLRQENEDTVCTLKTPAGNARNEWECKAETIEAGIKELCKLSGSQELASLTEKGVVAVCGARFERRAYTIMKDGTTLEVALDRGVLLWGGKEAPLCEVEVELKDGDPEAADALGRELCETYGLTPQKKSKFRRALDLAKGEA